LEKPHADELEPRELRVEIEGGDPAPGVVGRQGNPQRLVDEPPRTRAADPHVGAVADDGFAAVAGYEGHVEAAVAVFDAGRIDGRRVAVGEVLEVLVFRAGEDQSVGRGGGGVHLVVDLEHAVRVLALGGRGRPGAGQGAIPGFDVEFDDRLVRHGSEGGGEAPAAIVAHGDPLEGSGIASAGDAPAERRRERAGRQFVGEFAGDRHDIGAAGDGGRMPHAVDHRGDVVVEQGIRHAG
jgi:hypothetical protein